MPDFVDLCCGGAWNCRHPDKSCAMRYDVQRDEYEPGGRLSPDEASAMFSRSLGLPVPAGVKAPEPRTAFCPACFVEVTDEQAGAQIRAARALAEFAKTAPGRLPSRVQEALAVIDCVMAADPPRHATKENGDCPHWCEACKAESAERERTAGVEVVRPGLSVDEANTAVAVARTKVERLAAYQALAAAASSEAQRLAASGVPVHSSETLPPEDADGRKDPK